MTARSRPTRALSTDELIGSGLVLLEWVAAPSASGEVEPIAPLHVHLEDDEAWYVLSGRMGFSLDGEISEVEAGGAALAVAGTVHTYWNAGDEPARYLLVTTPRVRELIAVLHDDERRAGRTTDEVFRAYRSALVPPA